MGLAIDRELVIVRLGGGGDGMQGPPKRKMIGQDALYSQDEEKRCSTE